MHTLKLAVVALPTEWQQRQQFIDTLELAFSWLAGGWRLAEPEEADILVVMLRGDESSLTLWEEQRRIFPVDRIITYDCGHRVDEARWKFPPSSRGLPTALSIVNVLLKVEEDLLGIGIAEAAYIPEDYIQGVVNQALIDGISRVCSLPATPQTSLYIMPKEKACYILDNIERSIPICAARRDSLKIDTISDDELLRKVGYITFSSRLANYASNLGSDLFEDINFKKAKRYALKEFIWFATLVNSQGRLLATCAPDEPVLVKHAPEFIRLPYYQDYLKASKLMSSQAQRLTEVTAQTSLPMRQVVDFHNACALLDLTMQGEQARQEVQRYLSARKQLHDLLKPYAYSRGNRIKIVVAGTVGSGKTTLISTLSDFSPVTTETRPSDAVSHKKSSTTVAMDYGESRFTDMKLFLYGTPGQKRFEFMGEVLCNTAWALLIMIDNTEPDPLAEVDYYLRLYRAILPRLIVMFGITHYNESRCLNLDDYRHHLAQKGTHYPVAKLDPRDYLDTVRFFRDTVDGLALDHQFKSA
ncbi:GTP-binding protein [Methylomagnum sp.]